MDFVALAMLERVSNQVRQWIDAIPDRWLVAGICLIVLAFVVVVVKKLVWLAVVIAVLALAIGGLWLLAGKSIA